jgi:L,D-transpeptidase catalytic domain
MFRPALAALALVICLPSARCALPVIDLSSRVIISVRDQKLMLVQNRKKMATYPVSTSKFGLGDLLGRMTTPLGFLQVVEKIGDHAPAGAVFHNRRWTGEILAPNAPGRDPIVTRIIWLRGLEPENAHAFGRCIYIHGTPEERTIGRPASYGCIRMRSSDVTTLFAQIPLGTIVQIVPDHLPAAKTILTDAPLPSLNSSPNDKMILVRGGEKSPAGSARKPVIVSGGRGA